MRKNDGNDGAGQTRQAGRKARRWLRWLLIAFAALVVLIAALPYMLSTDLAKGRLLPLVNDRIHGHVAIDDISLGWFSPVVVRGVRVTDPEGREVLTVRSASAGRSLLRLATGWESFGLVEVDEPRAVLYLDASGGSSLQRAFQSRMPSAATRREGGPLPKLAGRIVVRDASVRLVRPDGRSYDVPDIDTEWQLATLANVNGRLEVRLVPTGRLLVKADLTSLAGPRQLQPGKASGTFTVQTPEAIDLTAIGRFAAPDADAAGAVSLDLDGSLMEGGVTARLRAGAAGLAAGGKARRAVRPVDIQLVGDIGHAGSETTGRLELAGYGAEGGKRGDRFARLAGSFRHVTSPAELKLSAAKVLAAVLKGEPLSLPDFALDANGTVDIPRLAAAVPAMLRIRPDVTVESGRVVVEEVAVRGGDKQAASGGLALRDLLARRGSREIRWQPVEANFEAAMEPGKGLRIRQLAVRSDFARLDANGLVGDLKAGYRADLAKLTDQLGEVIDLGGMKLAGDSRGELRATLEGERLLQISGNSSTRSLTFSQGGRKLDLAETRLGWLGSVDFGDANSVRVEATRVDLSADNLLTVRADARYNVTTGAMDANVSSIRADLAAAAGKARGLGVSSFLNLSGTLGGRMTAVRSGGGAPLRSEGRIEATGLRADGNSIGNGTAALTWDGVEVNAATGGVTVKTAKLQSDFATFVASGVNVALSGKPALAGEASLDADLAKVMALANAFGSAPAAGGKADRAAPPLELAGKLHWAGRARSEGKALILDGMATVSDLLAKRGNDKFTDPKLALQQLVRIDTDANSMTFDTLKLTSTLMSANLRGSLKDYAGRQELHLEGSYEGDWAYITAAMHTFAPGTGDLALAGKWKGPITVTGPLKAPKVRPEYRGVNADSAVTWDSGDYAGLKLGKADIPVRMDNGKVVVPDTSVAVSGGTANLAATVDLEPNVPMLDIPGRRMLLDKVEVNQEVGEKLLSRVNPIFADAMSLSGKVSLKTEDIHLPLDADQILRSGSGSGRLEFIDFRMRPKGETGNLLALGGIGSGGEVAMQISGLDFRIAKGALHYENFTISFGKAFDLQFKGSVSFDNTTSLMVSVPLNASILGKLGVKKDLLPYARALEGVRIWVPLLGTRTAPQLGWGKVDTQGVVKKLMEASVKGAAGQFLEGLRPKGLDDKGGGKSGPSTRPGLLPIPLPIPGPARPKEKPAPKPKAKPASPPATQPAAGSPRPTPGEPSAERKIFFASSCWTPRYSSDGGSEAASCQGIAR